MDTFDQLERSYESMLPNHGDFLFDIESDFTFSAPVSTQADAMGPEDEGDPAVRHAADTCFAAINELRRVKAQLMSSTYTEFELLIACERAGRKLRRALYGVLEAMAEADGRSLSVLDGRQRDLESAIAVRTMYSKFCRSLHPYDAHDPASVHRAVRHVAVSLAVVVGSRTFAEVRLCDRRILLSLQARILAWARAPVAREGIQLLQDIHAAADLLREINRRQELQLHDAQVLATIHELFPAPEEGEAAAWAQVAGQLQRLHGRDSELDTILHWLRKQRRDLLDPDTRSELQQILVRMRGELNMQHSGPAVRHR